MLGGSDLQVHAIRRAVDRGLHVVTCDNRRDNPGHRVAHEHHLVSTTDLEGVLALAQSLDIDGVLAYASDPAALTAAYVADRMGLAGDPLEAVRRAQDKLLLRAAQHEAGIPAPEFVDAADESSLDALRKGNPSGVIVKPVDSSGSRGVSILGPEASPEDVRSGLRNAYAASRSGRVIAEALWGMQEIQYGADVLVIDGAVRYVGFGDQIMSQARDSRINVANIGPSRLPAEARDALEAQAQALVTFLGLRNGVYNIDARPDGSGSVAIIDFGARIGGNLIALRHQAIDGIDLVDACLDIALGRPVRTVAPTSSASHAMMLIVQSDVEGTLRELRLADDPPVEVLHAHISVRPGDPIREYRTSVDRLGVLILRSDRRSVLEQLAADPRSLYTVRLQEDGT